MRTLLAVSLAATALVAQSNPGLDEPILAGILDSSAAAQFILPVHGFSATQLAYSPIPSPTLRVGATSLPVPDTLLCSASYAGGDVEQLVLAAPQGGIVLLDASQSLGLYSLMVPAGKLATPTGICIDRKHDQVVLLDAAQPSFLRIGLADVRAGSPRFESTSLPSAWSAVRGIAFDVARERIVGLDPTSGELLQFSANGTTTHAGELRPLAAVRTFGFAPTQNLDLDLFVTWGDERMLTDEWTWNASMTDDEVATLTATTDTSVYVPPCPDPSGITWDALHNRLVITDSEVEEMPIYANVNVFETNTAGVLARTTNTLSYSGEPTGITLDAATGTYYITDDDRDTVWVITRGPDGQLNTADDTRRPFRVNNFCFDAESIAWDNGTLWIAGGAASVVHRLRPGPNGIFDGTPPNGDDVVTSLDVTQYGVTDLSGVAVRAGDGGVYVLGIPKTRLLHMNKVGQLVRVVNLPNTSMVRPQGIAFAPSTVAPGDALYLVDRGHDNDTDPTENDGKMREYAMPAPAQINMAPVVHAGPDITISSGNPASLAGAAEDDGLPSGTLTRQWSKISGPGTVSFTAPTQAVTNATFSAPGTYILQLSASDGTLTATDQCAVDVAPGSILQVAVAASWDDAEEQPTAVVRSSTILDMSDAGTINQVVGLRFLGLTIPPGATIASAYVQFTTDTVNSVATALTIAGEANDNPPTFLTNIGNISTRPRTTATVSWSPVPWTLLGESGLNQRTPELASVVQQIVNRPGWLSGNALVFVITGTGCRNASSWDRAANLAPKLVVRYTTGTVNQAPIVNAGPDVSHTISTPTHLAGSVIDDGLPGPVTIAWTKVSGPGTVTFAPANLDTTDATFSLQGSYTLQLSANDGQYIRTDTCVVTVTAPLNQPPVVNAGPDVTTALATPAHLVGSVTDDGLPGPVTIAWTKVSGPGTATFAPANAAVTDVTFSLAGSYTLQLSANDGQYTVNDTVAVTVTSAPNQPPVVNAGPDLSHAITTATHIAGSVTDDGLNGPLTIAWTKVSGPGTATFAPATAAVTDVTFSLVGSYTLQLSANDGQYTVNDTVVVTVSSTPPVNQPPVVNAGPDLTSPLATPTHIAGSVTDDGLPGPVTIAWTKVSGPGTATFAPANAAVTDVTFSLAGSYTLQLSANDGQFTVNDTVAVTVTSGGSGNTVERTISAAADDAEEQTSSVSLTGSDIELCVDGANVQVVGLRFLNLTIPPGSTISSAFIQFAADEVWSVATNLTFAGQAADNAPAFTSAALNVSSRPRTTATVAWAPVPWLVVNEVGPNEKTPDLKTIVQQIVSRPGWASGNALAFVVTGTGTRTAVAFDTNPALAAKLIVNYQAGTPVNQPPVVNAGPDLNASLSPATHIAGSVTDDGLSGPLTITWTKVSGPGTATFAPANAAVTDVTFSLVGSYTLQLSATDGQYTVNDTVVVTVSTAVPITLNLAVAAGNDDAEQGGSSMDRGGPSLEMVMNGSTNQYVGIRFTGVTIPVGAVVTSAYLQFTNAVNNSSVASLVVAAQAADNPSGFGNGNNDISNRPRTTANVAWAPVAWTTVGAAGVDQRTPDLTAVVQQVVSRAAWASGNAMVFIITGSAGTRSATSFNGSSTNQPKLVITYHM